MIQAQTYLNVADNTGARRLMCIRPLRGTTAKVGDIIVAVVKEALPNGSIKKSDIVRAAIVRTKFAIKRKNGITLRFNDNAAIIISKTNIPRGTRIIGPIAYEIKKIGYGKISSLTKTIL